MRLLFRRAAKRDLQEARAWYENERSGLGGEFREALEATLARIVDHPELYPRVSDRIRRAPLRRFPYGIFYILAGRTIRVVAVLHHARSPERWQERR